MEKMKCTRLTVLRLPIPHSLTSEVLQQKLRQYGFEECSNCLLSLSCFVSHILIVVACFISSLKCRNASVTMITAVIILLI